MTATATAPRADYSIVASGDNGEFLTFATLALIYDGETVDIVEFSGSSEFPGEDAITQAISFGVAFVESAEMPFEERFAPYGPEWEREMEEAF